MPHLFDLMIQGRIKKSSTPKQSAAVIATALLTAKEKEVLTAAGALAASVGKTAVTAEDVTSVLMKVKDKPAPKPVPAQPTGLELKTGDEEGELSGQCEGQPGITDFYEMQYTTDDPNGPSPVWHFAGTSTKSSFEIQGLPSGQKVWIRVRACNARGKSTWSDPATKRVP